MDQEKLRAAFFRASQVCERLEANEAEFAAVQAKHEQLCRDSEELCKELRRLAVSNRVTRQDWRELRDQLKDRLDGSDGESWKNA